uniref:NADH dehydrogenase [ubiquinone] flavoprotein 3, mitochondrial n=1 Tax=Syphacia muris TaxID=451379 RepID=A0A0N5AVQ8_9BILA
MLSIRWFPRTVQELKQVRSLVSAAPKYTTGIEHAIELKKNFFHKNLVYVVRTIMLVFQPYLFQRGMKEKADPKAYKVQEYLNFNKWTFFDKELEMGPCRNQQPSKYKPDKQPSV